MSTDPGTLALGRVLFAAGMTALGLQNLVFADFLTGIEPVPVWVPAREFWANVTGITLTVTGLSIMANQRTRQAAGVLGFVLVLWILVLHVPTLIVEFGNGGAWAAAFEFVALAGAAWLLAAASTPDRDLAERRNSFVSRMATPARICFGIALPVFGILHFVYHDYIAGIIPAWIPGRPYWPYFTGVANIAAGTSILTTVKGRLGATLLAIMYGTWVLILHVPRVAADLDNTQEWTGLFLAVALCGGALIVAASLAETSQKRRHRLGLTTSESGE